jgi:hypothetical protein
LRSTSWLLSELEFEAKNVPRRPHRTEQQSAAAIRRGDTAPYVSRVREINFPKQQQT